MMPKGPTYAQACARCNTKKIKCHIRADDPRCEQCAASNAECTPRVRKKRKTTAQALDDSGANIDIGQPTVSVDGGSQMRTQTPSTILEHAAVTTPPSHFPNNDLYNPPSREARVALLAHDPGTGSSTYIGRSHLEGDAPVDESAARSYTQSRQTESSEIERKTLELWDVYALPPRPVLDSLTESFTEYCSPWMPVLEPADIEARGSPGSSLLLSQAVFLAASRVSSSTSLQAFSTPAGFYQRAKALYWVGHEKDPLTVIKAITMLHWYTPDGPAYVSYDTSEYWLRIGVGLAHQIGLHREPSPGPKKEIRRRVWWTLVVRDALISVSRGRPRAIQSEDFDVSSPTLEDFPESLPAGELFIAYVEICRTLGDLVQSCSRKQITSAKRSEVAATLFRWTRMLPPHLRLAEYSQHTQSYQLRPHDFRSRQLHVSYFACIIILSRVGHSHRGFVPAAIIAASFLAGIYEDLLARNLVCRLAPIFTTLGLLAGLALSSLRPHRTLWTAAHADLAIIHSAMQELSSKWRSAIGAAKVVRKAMDSDSPEPSLQTMTLPPLSREDASLFEGFPQELCRLWHVYDHESSSILQGGPITPSQIGPPAETFGQLQNLQDQFHSGPSYGLSLEQDNLLGATDFEGINDYFWGDWGLG
ncbi:hypothetical protein Q7P37_008566 [Cladosporium fusiforme]